MNWVSENAKKKSRGKGKKELKNLCIWSQLWQNLDAEEKVALAVV